MKTPMQEVYDNFNKMSDADFKSWMLNTDLLGKEKEMIETAFEEGMFHHVNGMTPKEYYEETFNTKEK